VKAIVLYGIALAVGGWILVQRQAPELVWVAARNLPAAHLLRGDDVVPARRSYYAKQPVSKGQAISLNDFSTVPELFGKEGEISFAVSAPRARVSGDGLNVGETARLCKEGKALEPVNVRLLLCPPDSSSCFGVASIATSRAQELAKHFEKGPLPYLQPTKTLPACK